MKLMLITGANGQIGAYLAKAYLAEGYKLALLYHKRSERIADLGSNPDVYAQALDLTDYSTVQNAIQQVYKNFGESPGYIIHCAALRAYETLPLKDCTPDIFHTIFNTNFIGTYNLLSQTIGFMQDKGFGRVVLMGSNVTRSGLKNGSAYSAAKAAMINLMKSVALEKAGSDVLLNAVSPAPVDTDLEEDYEGEYLEFRKRYFDEYTKASSTGKLISKEEIKKVIDLLIDPCIQNLSGQEIFLEGGLKQ